MKFEYFIYCRSWGIADRQKMTFFPLDNLLFICPTCGDVWARILAIEPVPADGPQPRYYTVSSKCPDHGVGTLRHPFDNKPLPTLPRPLLEREFLLACENEEYWYLNP